ncbi:glycosyltransferase family 2 protein [Halalkalibacter lacteus]|uniref:glycosyltransferase family 2 protein n=1 Tax=Halalkalibacter lacteus TaxID=3090663 RepID=UPI002FCC3416
MKPKVTIILTSYNKPNSVGDAIESVINQIFQDWELYIMDDASNEETQNVIQTYLKHPQIHYYNSYIEDEDRYKTTRYATLINEAIAYSKGEYISYLTDDNLYLPNRLKEMVQYLDEHQNIGVVYSKQSVKIVDKQLNVISERIRSTEGVLRKPQNIVDHCSVMHRRSLLDDIYNKYKSYWDDHPSNWHNADAAFWKRLTDFTLFYPIHNVLDVCLKGPNSFQNLNAFLPERIPSGTLVKGLGSTTFLIEGNKRREISDEMFKVLRYKPEKVVEIPDPILFKYQEGIKIDHSIFDRHEFFPNNRLLKAYNQPHIYYIEGNKKRHIISIKAFRKFHFQANEIIEMTRSFLEKIPNGEPISVNFSKHMPLPGGLLFKYRSNIYISEQNILYPIHSRETNKLKLGPQKAIVLNQNEFNFYNKGNLLEWKAKKWK